MKKFLLVALLIVNAQIILSQGIEHAFMHLPNHYFPLLTKEQRAEFIFVYRHHHTKVDSTINTFGGISRLSVLDLQQDYLKMENTERSSFEMKVWTKSDSTKMIGFSHTVCGPACDSHLAFFDPKFRRLDMDNNNPVFPSIAISDFLDKEKIKADGESVEHIANKYDILFASVTFLPDNNLLVQSNTKDYLPEEIYEAIKPYLLGDKMTLIWTDGFFEKGQVTW